MEKPRPASVRNKGLKYNPHPKPIFGNTSDYVPGTFLAPTRDKIITVMVKIGEEKVTINGREKVRNIWKKEEKTLILFTCASGTKAEKKVKSLKESINDWNNQSRSKENDRSPCPQDLLLSMSIQDKQRIQRGSHRAQMRKRQDKIRSNKKVAEEL